MSSATRFIKLISRSQHPTSNFVKLGHHGLTRNSGDRYHLSNYTRMQAFNIHRRKFSVNSSEGQPSSPLPPQLPSSNFLRWILGLVGAIIVPSTSNTWVPLLQFKKDVDTTVEKIEEMVEVLEKVAEVVDKVAEEISDDLPDGGKMKKVVEILEDVAEATAKDARIVGDAIDKFQEVEDKVEDMVARREE